MEINPNALCKVNELLNPGKISMAEGNGGFKGLYVTEVANQDFASVASGAVGGLEMTVSGVALGDAVLAVCANVDIGDKVRLHGQVTATDTGIESLFNFAAVNPRDKFLKWSA